jgi:HPt (histidine-containing phosphotransfer) domain-containing protein
MIAEINPQSVELIDLEALKRRCLGNTALVERILRKFPAQLDADLASLESALASGNASEYALIVHRIKGMSANVEARRLHREATSAEQCALDGNTALLPWHLDRLRCESRRLMESLNLLPTEHQS